MDDSFQVVWTSSNKEERFPSQISICDKLIRIEHDGKGIALFPSQWVILGWVGLMFLPIMDNFSLWERLKLAYRIITIKPFLRTINFYDLQKAP